MRKETANKILTQTELGYDSIADKFSQTRKHFWRGLEYIKEYARAGDNILDYGCGNGRLLELIGDRDIHYQGADVSGNLIELASQKYGKLHPVKSAEGGAKQLNRASFAKLDPVQTTLAFESEYFNSVYSIAVFHHFPSRKYRQEIAAELCRVTKDGGHVVVTVWYLWQKKYFQNILENWKNKLLGKSSLDWNDCMISFTDNSGKKFSRFHHAFTKRELRKLFQQAGFEIERCEIPDGRNIVLVGRK